MGRSILSGLPNGGGDSLLQGLASSLYSFKPLHPGYGPGAGFAPAAGEAWAARNTRREEGMTVLPLGGCGGAAARWRNLDLGKDFTNYTNTT